MKHRAKPSFRLILLSATIFVLLAAMVLNTKVVKINSSEDSQPNVFDPAAYGVKEFPGVQAGVEARAVSADTLWAAIAKDQNAAEQKYGVPGDGIGPEISVKFTGVAGQERSGIYFVAVNGIPKTVIVRVQAGPAIIGTDLRDATGVITFEQFTNQIDYQNAGSALNEQMKAQVLAKVDTSALTGKTISVVGVFQLINPNSWLVTPVKLDVK